ncbi:alkaline phosphatase family protein [Panacibacter ginsenosidivorans]|uniref:Alkaline phosphatase family protein n=1 Tax=Panacibacter ginsenosidivorans TaxID=1813871 RepID=A0A5B8V7N7_9BACT|nr:alkaline phosphatase family protein [Panacibacter ginsenosidivorans]QEC67279.1 alkaline phosphatase family protein [Panacibacter ginsenosidivorans]
MKNILIASLLLITVSSFAQTKKAVFIIIDGIPADLIERLNAPTIKEISKGGGFVHAYCGGEKGTYDETPTISAVGYTTILTGTWVNKHNVWDNDGIKENYNYKTIFRYLKDIDPSKKIAIFSTWLDNRTILCGDGLPETNNLRFDYAFDGLELDTVHYPHDKNADYIKYIDDTVSTVAGEYIKANGPDLSWVYLEHTDDMGHRYGDSKQYYDAIEAADTRIKKVWDAIQYRKKQFGEDWLIIITTDHGRDSSGHNHGGQSDREKNGWIATNAKNLNAEFKTDPASQADIMPAIANFMNISIPKENAMEIDGTSFIGTISANKPTTKLENGKITINWNAVTKEGNAKLWLATTNNFKTGGKDEYKMVAEIPLSKQQAIIDVSKMPSAFYKIVIETPTNILNRWIAVK